MAEFDHEKILKGWGKIGIVLTLFLLVTFALDKCESSSSNRNSYEYEKDDFDMMGVQRP